MGRNSRQRGNEEEEAERRQQQRHRHYLRPSHRGLNPRFEEQTHTGVESPFEHDDEPEHDNIVLETRQPQTATVNDFSALDKEHRSTVERVRRDSQSGDEGSLWHEKVVRDIAVLQLEQGLDIRRVGTGRADPDVAADVQHVEQGGAVEEQIHMRDRSVGRLFYPGVNQIDPEEGSDQHSEDREGHVAEVDDDLPWGIDDGYDANVDIADESEIDNGGDAPLDVEDETDDEQEADVDHDNEEEEEVEERDEEGLREEYQRQVREQILRSTQPRGCECKRKLPRERRNAGRTLTMDGISTYFREVHVPDLLNARELSDRNVFNKVYQWRNTIAGGEVIPALDLQVSQVQGDVETERVYDIDAVLLPLQTLAAYREGFRICYYSLWRPTLESNQFVKMFGHRLHRCKNQRLGMGRTSSSWPVYIFFPHAHVHKHLHLSDDQQKMWLEGIVFPSVKEVYDFGHTHHHPSSFAEVRDKSRAKQLESTSGIDKRPMELLYELPDVDFEGRPGQLEQLWDAMQRRIRMAGRGRGAEWLQDAFLVTIRFDCKQAMRRQRIADLKRVLDESIDRELRRDLTHLWVDIGCEEFARAPGIVLLRKSLCNQADARNLGLRSVLEYPWQGTRSSGFNAFLRTLTRSSALSTRPSGLNAPSGLNSHPRAHAGA